MKFYKFNENKHKRIAKGIKMNVKLIECFNTYQGEGPDTGRAMLLTRFKYCNKNCYFCDTKVQMRIAMEGEHSLKSLQTQINEHRLGLLITGGEPTHPQHYDDTLKLLKNLNYRVANVETNGYQLERLLGEQLWENLPIKFIYSPKILDQISLYIERDLTKQLLNHRNVYIKIPFHRNEYTLAYCKWLSDTIIKMETDAIYDESYDYKVWLMPMGATKEDQKHSSNDVMDACEKFKFNFSGRMHIMYDFI